MAKHTAKRAMEVVCRTCGITFVTGSSIKHHCSPECRVREVAGAFTEADSCWPWPGSLNPATGYGQLSSWEGGKRRLYTAHRISFSAFHGSIPEGQQVLHRCDNKPCFNPAHLFLGTQMENMRDMIGKDRAVHYTPSGSKHFAAKLTESDVQDIRKSSKTIKALAEQYGMSLSAMHGVKTGRTWRHVQSG